MDGSAPEFTVHGPVPGPMLAVIAIIGSLVEKHASGSKNSLPSPPFGVDLVEAL